MIVITIFLLLPVGGMYEKVCKIKYKNNSLVIVLNYNGGMVHTVEIKEHQLGERIQVRDVMLHINVRIII